MFCDCEELRKELIRRDESMNKSICDLAKNLELLFEHLKLEINEVPATERKRVIEKLGTNAKKPKEYNPYLNALKQDLQMRGLSPSCACRGSFPEPGAIHSVFNCKSKT